MSQLRSVTNTLLGVIAVCFAIAYTSCKQDNCQGVTCFNNASCSNGSCKCLPGFSGINCATRAITNIVYQNNTYSTIQIDVTTPNGNFSNDIGPGTSFDITGGFSTQAIATITVFGNGTQQISWNLNDTFPSSGVTTIPINVSSDYFFLKVINNSASYYIDKVIVNYNLPTQVSESSLYINNDGTLYNVGYFHAVAGANVYLYNTSSSQTWSFTSLSLPDTVDQVFTAIVN